jgi:hypothetical protein
MKDTHLDEIEYQTNNSSNKHNISLNVGRMYKPHDGFLGEPDGDSN